MSQSEWGLGRGGVKEIFPCSIVPADSKQAISIIHRDSVLQKERGYGLPGPRLKNAAPLKACSSSHRWHVRFQPWPISCRIFTIEARYGETSERRRSVLVWMKWLQHNYYCYVLLFDQTLLFFMPDVLSLCVKACKSLFLHIPHFHFSMNCFKGLLMQFRNLRNQSLLLSKGKVTETFERRTYSMRMLELKE